MKLINNKKLAVQIISVVCIILIITPACNAGLKTDNIKMESKENNENFEPSLGGTEY